MNYATIKYYDIANGPGVRTSVFVSGCRHHCPGCFNEVAWDFGYGSPFDKPVRNEVFASCKPDYIAGLSLLGGEPMEPENQRELVTFVQNFKALYPKKTVWCYSGYTWEQLTGKVPCHARCEVTDELLRLLDVLVDGRFVEAEHDISLRSSPPIRWNDKKSADLSTSRVAHRGRSALFFYLFVEAYDILKTLAFSVQLEGGEFLWILPHSSCPSQQALSQTSSTSGLAAGSRTASTKRMTPLLRDCSSLRGVVLSS